MDTKNKPVIERPVSPPKISTLRCLVLSLCLTLASVIFALASLLVGLSTWSFYARKNMFREVLTFVNDHTKEELDRVGCMIIPIIAIPPIILANAIPITRILPSSIAGHGKGQPLGRKEMVMLATWGLTITGLGSWSNWHQYQSLVRERHGKEHHLFGKRAEEAFLSVPNGPSAIEASRLYATKPHLAGTVNDLSTAREFLALLQRELGISQGPPSEHLVYKAGSAESQSATRSVSKTTKSYAWIDTYYPVMNTPMDRTLEIVDDDGNSLLTTSLVEFSDFTDPDASKYGDEVPTFHGLSQGGDVTGPLVDGNYCTYEDYQQLLANNVEIKGSIVLCRYGGIFRGLKVKGGQELGAVGVLIYSDPRDDGTVTNNNGYQSYPYGPARNPTSVQRGSVQYLSTYPGDPTTPGYPSYENSTRAEGDNIPKIPSLPISWTNANIMFRTLNKGDELEGKRVRLVNNVDTRVIPIWNVLGVIPGYIKDEVVVVGNHRDAWVLGATDPSSGTASVHEVIRGLGHLLRKGWKPLRTILIASWDAEEYGLIGSTEWGEDFKDWIDAHVVTYLNLDSSVSGSRFRASGSPLLAHFIRATAEELPHPIDNNRTLWDARLDEGILLGPNGNISVGEEVISMHEMQHTAADSVGVSPLGSGSDYTVFLQRSGIPCTNGGFGATLHDAAYHYHSIFDSERWQEIWADPGFSRHVSVAKHLGLQTLRLATSPILPFNATHYAHEVESYLQGIETLAFATSLAVDLDPLKKSIEGLQIASAALDAEKESVHKDLKKVLKKWKKRHSNLKRKVRKVLCRIKKALGRKCSCPHRNNAQKPPAESITDDEVVIGMLLHADGDGDLKLVNLLRSFGRSPYRPHHKLPIKKLREIAKRIRAVNKKTTAIEKGFISEDGIKDREWYKHLAVAPGKWLGYGATTFPALSEAIQYERNTTLAQYEVGRLQNLIDKIVEAIQV